MASSNNGLSAVLLPIGAVALVIGTIIYASREKKAKSDSDVIFRSDRDRAAFDIAEAMWRNS